MKFRMPTTHSYGIVEKVKIVKYIVLGPTADRKCQINVTVISANSTALFSYYIQYSRLPLGCLDNYPPGTLRITCLQLNM